MENLHRMDVSTFKESAKIPVVIVLDNLRSAHNIGSIFRTADAFRIEALYLTGICASPPHKEIMKTALGAADSVIWKYFDTTGEAIQSLRNEGCMIAAVEQSTKSTLLQNFIPGIKTAYVFGNEINGVNEEVLSHCDTCIEIPQFGTKHSFNVSITTGIILWNHFLKTKAL